MRVPGSPFFDHDAHARSVDERDFRRQVKRIIDGNPLRDNEVHALADFVTSMLDSSVEDHLLDVGCGNGELLSLYASGMASAVGIDPSEHLISIALKYFASDRLSFIHTGTVEYLERVVDPERFTRVCFFASFQYLSPHESMQALQVIGRRFTSATRLVLGNLPDLSRREAFAADAPRCSDPLNEHLTTIGRWLTLGDIEELAPREHFTVERVAPAVDVAGGHYRFHVVLKRTPPA
jgi:cyclopropane fatty-acyl-phospholipid synthase-like methyltransferase